MSPAGKKDKAPYPECPHDLREASPDLLRKVVRWIAKNRNLKEMRKFQDLFDGQIQMANDQIKQRGPSTMLEDAIANLQIRRELESQAVDLRAFGEKGFVEMHGSDEAPSFGPFLTEMLKPKKTCRCGKFARIEDCIACLNN